MDSQSNKKPIDEVVEMIQHLKKDISQLQKIFHISRNDFTQTK